MHLTIHTDGGSLNNPGPSACAFVIESGGKLVHEEAFFLGNQTNNVAEYEGVIRALIFLTGFVQNNSVSRCDFICDSLLLVNQVLGVYRVKQPHLKPLHAKVGGLIKNLSVPITFKHTLREGNVHADELVKSKLYS